MLQEQAAGQFLGSTGLKWQDYKDTLKDESEISEKQPTIFTELFCSHHRAV